MSGFVLSTQLDIQLDKSKISKIKADLNKSIGTFTTNIKLQLDKSEIAKIDKQLNAAFATRPVEIHCTASRNSRKLISDDLRSFTQFRPIPLNFTASASSFREIRNKINAGFGASYSFRIPFAPSTASVTNLVRDIRRAIDAGFFRSPARVDVLASVSSLNAMRTQIINFFRTRPVPINVTTGAVGTRQPRQGAAATQRFQPANNLQNVGAKIGKSIEHYGTFTTAVGTFVALFRSMQNAVSEAIKFDREMVRISQVTGVTVSGLKDLDQEVTRVSKAYGVSSTEILKSAVTLSQAGLSAKDTKVALDAIAATGVSATFDNITDTTEASIAIFQQFGKKAEDLRGILSSVNKVSGAYAIESSDVTVAVRRAGGAFQAAGGNLEEFIALLTSVRQTTRESAETIATGFKTIFARLQRSSTQNLIKSLGIDLLNDKGLFIGPYQAIQKIGEALKDIESTDPRFAQIVEELGGFRQVSKVIPLLQQTAIQQRALSLAMRGGNSLAEDSALANQSLAVQLAKVKETFLDTVRAFASNDTIKATINITLEITKAVLGLTKALTPLIPLILALGTLKLATNFPQVFGGLKGHFTGGAAGGLGGLGGIGTAAGAIGAGVASRSSNKLTKQIGGGVAVAGLLLPTILEKVAGSLDKFGIGLDKIVSVITSAGAQIYLFSVLMRNLKLSEMGRIGTAIESRFGQTGSVNRAITNVNPRDYRYQDINDEYMYSGRTPFDDAARNAKIRNRAERDAARRFQRIQTGALVGGAAATAIGFGVSQYNDNEIAAGKGSAVLGGAAGLATGAGTGALLAASLGLGPLGIAFATLTTGTIGLYTAFTAASNAIKNNEFNKDFEALSEKLKKVFDNKLSPTSQAASISDTIRKSSGTIGQLSSLDAKNALAQFKNDQPGLERFFNAVAQESRTFDEFQAKTKGVLSTFSALSGLPYGELESSIKKTIDLQNTLNKKIAESSEVVADELQQRVRLIALESAFNSAFASGNDLDTKIDRILSRLGGKSSKVGGVNIQSVFSQAGEGRFADPDLVNNLARNIGANFGGRANESIATLAAVNKLTQDLPSILVKLRSQDPLGESGNFLSNFDKELTGLPDSIRRTILASADKAIGPEGKTGEFLEKIGTDLEGSSSEILKSIKHIFDTFGKFGGKLQEHTDAILAGFSVYNDTLDNIIEIQQKSRDASRDYNDFLLGLNGGSITGQTLLGRRNQDLQGNFGATDVNVLAAARAKADKELTPLLEQREANKANLDLFKSLTEQINPLERASRDAARGLEDIANDSSGYISSLKQLIEQTRRETQVRSDYARTLVSGSRDEKRDLSKNIYNAALAIRNGLDSLPADLRAGALSVLDANKGEVFSTGKTGVEQSRRLQIDSLTGDFVRAGDTEKRARERATETLDNKPKSVQDLLAQFNVAAKAQEDAFNAIKANLLGEKAQITLAITDGTRQVVEKLQKLIDKDVQSALVNEKTDKELKVTEAKNRLVATSKLGDIIGRKDLGPGDINEARTLLENLRQRKNIQIAEDKLLSNLTNDSTLQFRNKDFGTNAQEVTTGLLKIKEGEIARTIPGFTFSQALQDKARSKQFERGELNKPRIRTTLDEFGNPVETKYTLAEELTRAVANEVRKAKKTALEENAKNRVASGLTFKDSKFPGFESKANTELINELDGLLKTIGDQGQSEKNLQLSIDKLTQEIKNIDTKSFLQKTGGALPAFPILPQLQVNAAQSIKDSQIFARFSGGSQFSKIANVLSSDKNKQTTITENIKRFQDNLAKDEKLQEQKDTVRNTETKVFAATQASRGETSDLRLIKSNIFGKALPDRNLNGGPRLKSYGSLDEEGNFISADSTKNQELGRETRKKLNEARIQREYERRTGIKATQSPVAIIPPVIQETLEQQKKRILDTKHRFTQSQGLPQFGLTGNAPYPELPRTRPGTRPGGEFNTNVVAPVTNAGTRPITPTGQTNVTVPQPQDLSGLTAAFEKFYVNSDKLAAAMNKFPSEITLTGTHKVEVIFNGAEVLTRMSEEMGKIAIDAANKEISRYANMNDLPVNNPVGVEKGRK